MRNLKKPIITAAVVALGLLLVVGILFVLGVFVRAS